MSASIFCHLGLSQGEFFRRVVQRGGERVSNALTAVYAAWLTCRVAQKAIKNLDIRHLLDDDDQQPSVERKRCE